MGAGMGYLAASAQLRESLDSLLPGVRTVLSVGLNYNQKVGHELGQARIARYALGRDYHKVLRSKLRRVGASAEERWGCRWRVAVDSAPLLEREWAHRAGLGWIGKNTCLINSRQGSWFVLGFLLLDHPLPGDEPAVGGCGTCRACIDQCPTGAIVPLEGRWVVDSRRCISYWTIEHRGDFPPEAEIGEWTFGCDVCQEVCPFNQQRESQPERAAFTSESEFEPRPWPPLEDLIEISYEDWDRLTQGSPARRAGWDGLKRNARENIRNTKKTGAE
jgi:epoxyqueuosine reductase